MPEENKFELIDAIQGSNYLAIESAAAAIQAQGIDLARFAIEVTGGAAAAKILLFTGKDAAGALHPFAVRQGADAALSAQEFEALIAQRDKLKTADHIKGSSFLAIHTAVPVFQAAFKANLLEYKIEVIDQGASVIVLFADKDREPGIHGSAPPRLGYEVELDAETRRTIRSNFVR